MNPVTTDRGATRTRRPAVLVIVLVVVVVVVALLAAGARYAVHAYRDFNASAEDNAREELLGEARDLAGYAVDVLRREPSAAAAQRLVARDKPEVFASRVTAGGDAEWDAVLIGRGSSRSSWTDDEIAIRTCIRLTGRAGPSAAVRRTDLPCPASVSDPRRYGSYEKTVTLPPEG